MKDLRLLSIEEKRTPRCLKEKLVKVLDSPLFIDSSDSI